MIIDYCYCVYYDVRTRTIERLRYVGISRTVIILDPTLVSLIIDKFCSISHQKQMLFYLLFRILVWVYVATVMEKMNDSERIIYLTLFRQYNDFIRTVGPIPTWSRVQWRRWAGVRLASLFEHTPRFLYTNIYLL